MIHLFFFEVGPASRTHLWLRIPPSFLKNTTTMQNLRRNRRVCFGSFGFVRPFFPHCTEFTRGIVLIDRFQVPTQNNCGKRQPPKEFFKIRSDRSFAFERLDPTNRGQKLRVQLAKQRYLSCRKIPLLRSAQNCDSANESLLFPKEKRNTIGAFLRRHAAAIKARSYKAAVIAKKIIQTQQLLASRLGDATPESFCREEILGHGSRPLCNRGHNRVLLKQ